MRGWLTYLSVAWSGQVGWLVGMGRAGECVCVRFVGYGIGYRLLTGLVGKALIVF